MSATSANYQAISQTAGYSVKEKSDQVLPAIKPHNASEMDETFDDEHKGLFDTMRSCYNQWENVGFETLVSTTQSIRQLRETTYTHSVSLRYMEGLLLYQLAVLNPIITIRREIPVVQADGCCKTKTVIQYKDETDFSKMSMLYNERINKSLLLLEEAYLMSIEGPSKTEAKHSATIALACAIVHNRLDREAGTRGYVDIATDLNRLDPKVRFAKAMLSKPTNNIEIIVMNHTNVRNQITSNPR